MFFARKCLKTIITDEFPVLKLSPKNLLIKKNINRLPFSQQSEQNKEKTIRLLYLFQRTYCILFEKLSGQFFFVDFTFFFVRGGVSKRNIFFSTKIICPFFFFFVCLCVSILEREGV
jgi:hypothetical protein